MSDTLTPDEDAELRRLHYFERFGCDLSPSLAAVKRSIRARDKRGEVRDPADGLTARAGKDRASN